MRLPTGCFLVAVFVCMWGCGKGTVQNESMRPSYAIVEPNPTDVFRLAGNQWRVEREPIERSKDHPQIVLEAKFLMAEARQLRELGFLNDEGIAVLREKAGQDVLAVMERDLSYRWTAAPRLTMYSGQEAYAMLGRQTVFVQDFAVHENDAGEAVGVEPVIGTMTNGLALFVDARLVDGKVVFDRLEPRTNMLLGMRNCEADVVVNNATQRVRWQEPSGLIGRAIEGKVRGLALGSGEVLVIPLVYRVEQSTANVRAMAKDGWIGEKYESRYDLQQFNVARLTYQTVVLVQTWESPRK